MRFLAAPWEQQVNRRNLTVPFADLERLVASGYSLLGFFVSYWAAPC